MNGDDRRPQGRLEAESERMAGGEIKTNESARAACTEATGARDAEMRSELCK